MFEAWLTNFEEKAPSLRPADIDLKWRWIRIHY